MLVSITNYKSEDLSELNQIFWETSVKKDFKDQAERESFYYKYLGYYLENFPTLCFVAKDSHNKVLGYICASLVNTATEFPAELHINCSSHAQGKGVGSKLLAYLETKLIELKVPGVHLKTGVKARNVSFYVKNGYLELATHENILSLGKKLSSL